MSRKFKRLVRQVSSKAGVTHEGAVNLLRRGNPVLNPLDPVSLKKNARPLGGAESTHPTGLVSLVMSNGDVVITPGTRRETPDGIVFDDLQPPVRYAREDVLRFPFRKGDKRARFIEELFMPVTVDTAKQVGAGVMDSLDGLPVFIFPKPLDVPALMISETADSVVCVSRPRHIVLSLWEVRSDIVHEDQVVGQDAVAIMRSLRERMVAILTLDMWETEPRPATQDPEWFVEADGNGQILTRPLDPEKAYACGIGRPGRHVTHSTHHHGLLAFSQDFAVVGRSPKPEMKASPNQPHTLYKDAPSMLRAVRERFLAGPGREVLSTDAPRSLLLGFTVCDGDVNYPHSMGITGVHDLEQQAPHLMRRFSTQTGRREIAQAIQQGIDVLDPSFA